MKTDEPTTELRTDWNQVANDFLTSALFGTLLTTALRTLRVLLNEEKAQRGAQASTNDDADLAAELADDVDAEDAAIEAATLLGVDLNSNEREVRAALRAHLTFSRLHPDHGGDNVKTALLLQARNLLIERARARAFDRVDR